MDTLAEGDDPGEILVLSTIHQAKGLEWSRVFVPRLIEDSFPELPGPGRARRRGRGASDLLRRRHPGDGRALPDLPPDDLPGRTGPSVVTTPSRFLTEIDPGLYEPVILETEFDAGWSRPDQG